MSGLGSVLHGLGKAGQAILGHSVELMKLQATWDLFPSSDHVHKVLLIHPTDLSRTHSSIPQHFKVHIQKQSWYLWVSGSKETIVEETPCMGQAGEGSLLYCESLVHLSHTTTQLLLKTCHLLTNLKMSLDHFNYAHSLLPCILGTICLLGGRFSQNEGQGDTQQITQ
jgi:hypothetical protein